VTSNDRGVHSGCDVPGHSLVTRPKKTIMKTIFVWVCVLFSSLAAYAQEPVPEPDTLKNQVNQKDPTPDNIAPDANYTADKIKITTADLPREIKKTLNAGSEYTGWERGQVYKSKDSKLYILQMSKGDTTRTFRFDTNGKLILD
jgi:hypothetical protein